MSAHQYDPNVIIQAAEEKVLLTNDFEGGQMIFQSALLDWVDDAREGIGGSNAGSTGMPPPIDPESMKEAVGTLWLAYAQFLAKHNQFKSATEAYEQAVACPIASSLGRVWLEYARFAEERGKLKTAQDVYIRALTTQPLMEEHDTLFLWQEFLDMMRKTNPDLTMAELQGAVHQNSALPEPTVSSSAIATEEPFAKRIRMEGNLASASTNAAPIATTIPGATLQSYPIIVANNHVVTADAVEEEAKAFGEIISGSMAADLAAAWMMRDGTDPAQAPEPPLFQPSPPKLSDPTAKDILGTELSYQVIDRILNSSGNLLLDTCRALWALQAMKEKKTAQSIDSFDTAMKEELRKLEASLEARLAVVADEQIKVGVSTMNELQRRAFQSTCSQQRQNLLTAIAWEFRQLLAVQQLVLTKLQVPTFDGPTVDPNLLELQARVCSYLHSAFYLRNRVGEEPHVNMLKGHIKALQRELDASVTNPPISLPYGGMPSSQTVQVPQYPLAMYADYSQQQQPSPPPPPPQLVNMAPHYPGLVGHGQLPPPPPSYGNQPPYSFYQ